MDKEIIGLLIEGKIMFLGQTNNGFMYKNKIAFREQTDEICYIPQHGVEGDLIEDDSNVYRYKDLYKMAKAYVDKNQTGQNYEEVAQAIFDLVDWQFPSSIILEWENEISEEI